jgi:predicted TIM-barrel fold metal-dependent hydrolase
VRFNLHRGRSAGVDELERLARRLHDVAGWHAELYVDSRDLAELAPVLGGLPQAVIDHLGLSGEGLIHVLRLVERGAKVKASGFGRVDLDVSAALQAVARTDPGALLFGTDLPSTRAPRPFSPADVELLADALGDDDLVQAALHDNAVRLYRSGADGRPSLGT